MMIKGATVTVLRPGTETEDDFGNLVAGEPTTETVDDVLIVPGQCTELEASRPNGVAVAYTLHIPKSYTNTLEYCFVVLTGQYSGTYRVIDQGFYMDANTPTRWNRAVELEAAHG